MRHFLKYRYGPTSSEDDAPEIISAPIIVGTPTVGIAAVFLPGVFSGDPQPTVANVWVLDGVALSSNVFTPATGDAGKTLSPRSTATNRAGVAVSDGLGAVIASAATVLPGQVTGVGSTQITSNSVVISWTAPASGGAPTDYRVEYKTSASPTWLVVVDGVDTQTAKSITGLIASTAHDVRVSAFNGAGFGQVSDTHTFTTAVAATGNDILVEWDAPAFDGDGAALTDLAGYKVKWGTTSFGPYPNASAQLPLSPTSYTIVNPGVGTWYCVVVSIDAGGNESDPGPQQTKTIV